MGLPVSNWASFIASQAPKYGVDPQAALKVANVEGLSGKVGDGGHAFGPFQLNDAGGTITNRPGNHQAFAESPAGIDWALQQIGKVAGGLHGAQAVDAIVRKFERPADPNGEVARALGQPANAAWGTPSSGGGKAGQGQKGLPPITPANFVGSTSQTSEQLRQLLSQAMMNQASATISGGGPQVNSNSLMQMAMLRQQLSAAQDTYGQVFNPNAPQQKAPTVNGGWAGKALDGSTSMVVGGKSPFSNLKFQSNVDWQHVNPRLLKTINDVAAQHNVVATINSGYRDSKYSAANGGFTGDPHTKGLAVDAYVNGQPIGSVFGANVWSHYGVRSGNVPNFYKGQADPEHLDLLTS